MTLCSLVGFTLCMCAVSALVTTDRTCTALPVQYITYPDSKFTCQASGKEPITYEWRRKKDGQPWETVTSNKYRTVVGGVMTLDTILDEGTYECIAKNDVEVAVSRIEIKKASMGSFSMDQVPVSERASVGDYKTIKCRDPPPSYPNALYSWWIADHGPLRGEAYSVDFNGTLHMLNVRMEDASYYEGKEVKRYMCAVFNSEKRTVTSGSPTRLEVSNTAGARPYRAPTIKYASDNVDIQIAWNVNKNFTLMCVADGSPEIPKIRWRREGGKDIHDLDEFNDRYTIGDYGRKINVGPVQIDDVGHYECYIEGNTDIYKRIRVNVMYYDMPRPLHVSIESYE